MNKDPIRTSETSELVSEKKEEKKRGLLSRIKESLVSFLSDPELDEETLGWIEKLKNKEISFDELPESYRTKAFACTFVDKHPQLLERIPQEYTSFWMYLSSAQKTSSWSQNSPFNPPFNSSL